MRAVNASTDALRPAGLLRRLAAMLYDALLLLALFMLAGGVALLATGGEAVPAGSVWYQAYLLLIAMLFLCGFWINGGQTLGLRSWRLRVESADGGPLDARMALLRFAAGFVALAPAGLGLFWLLFDPERRAWHDRLSGTRVVLLPKQPRDGVSAPE
jgi:uncharacterized RDD family membrane protein YckC